MNRDAKAAIYDERQRQVTYTVLARKYFPDLAERDLYAARKKIQNICVEEKARRYPKKGKKKRWWWPFGAALLFVLILSSAGRWGGSTSPWDNTGPWGKMPTTLTESGQ